MNKPDLTLPQKHLPIGQQARVSVGVKQLKDVRDAQSAGFGESGKILKIQHCALACPGWEVSEGGMGLSIYPGLRTSCHK